ncbi:MAG: hypothetical protein PHW69_05270 [Elusimicrobiaceae bacterium]|nr:hypothetical protein [Elusimicrobiaceae bacterium]
MFKLLFYTEGGKEHGYGRLARCRTLYDEFVKAGHAARFLVTGDRTISGILAEDTYTLCNWLADEPDRCDLAVIDSGRAGEQDCARIAAKAKLALYLDDNNRLAYPAGMVLNGALAAEKIKYPRAAGRHYLLGPKYQLIRPEFLGGGKENLPPAPRSVLVTFGGNDRRNLSPVALKVLTEHFPGLEKNVAVGKSYTNGRDMARYTDPKTLFFYAPGAGEMAQLMRLSDFAVCAGGQTLFELAACGTPAAVIGIADNHDQNIKGWLDAGFISFAGWHDDSDIETNLLHAVNAITSPGALAEKTGRGGRFINPGAAREVFEVLAARLMK